jgi:hypothetical protein
MSCSDKTPGVSVETTDNSTKSIMSVELSGYPI